MLSGTSNKSYVSGPGSLIFISRNFSKVYRLLCNFVNLCKRFWMHSMILVENVLFGNRIGRVRFLLSLRLLVIVLGVDCQAILYVTVLCFCIFSKSPNRRGAQKHVRDFSILVWSSHIEADWLRKRCPIFCEHLSICCVFEYKWCCTCCRYVYV